MPSSRPRALLVAVVSVALLALALWVLHQELTRIHLADVRWAFGQVGWPAFVLALLATAGSYLALTGYDVLALRHLKQPLPYWRVAVASFIATVVRHNLGLAMLTAGAVRMRLYTAWGLSAPDVALMAGLVTITFAIGATGAAGLALLLEPAAVTAWLHLNATTGRAVGVMLLAAIAVYLAFAWRRRRPLTLLEINLPEMDGFAVMQCLRESSDTRDIPVVAISANAMPRDIERGRAAGFADYMTKPIDIARLLALVDSLTGPH